MNNVFPIHTKEFTSYQFNHTSHSKKRAQQRGVKNHWLSILIAEGEKIYKQGLVFHFMRDCDLRYYSPKIQKKLKNLVVLVDETTKTVITCYKNKDAVRNIKRKNKRLARRA
jgi:hypothetical protein